MDMTMALAGVIAALVAQLTKAEGWDPWVKKLYGASLATIASLVQNSGFDQQAALLAVAAALATHSFLLANTGVGQALKWNMLGRLGDVVKAIFPTGNNGGT